MIDSIHMVLSRSFVSRTQIEHLYQIIYNKSRTERINDNQTIYYGNYKNFKVCIFEKHITLNGSLPKFLFDHNLFVLTHTEVIKALKLLSNELGLPLFKAHISRLDVAENIILNYRTRLYFPWLLDTPKYCRNRSSSVQYTKGNVEFVFYDKTEDVVRYPTAHSKYQSANIVRIELRIKKNIRRHLGLEYRLYVLHLLSQSFFCLLAREWQKHYESILKQRQLYKPPVMTGWKGFQDYLFVLTLLEKGFMQAYELMGYIAEKNKWSSRTLREVRHQMYRLYNGNYTQSNSYIKEIDEKVKSTYTYSLAVNSP